MEFLRGCTAGLDKAYSDAVMSINGNIYVSMFLYFSRSSLIIKIFYLLFFIHYIDIDN